MAVEIARALEAGCLAAAAEAVQRLVDWIKQTVDEAGVQPQRPATAHVVTTSRAETNAQGSSASVSRRSELPVAMWQTCCARGLPVTVMIYATKSRFILRAVATDNSDFVSTQLMIDVNEPKWADLVQPATSREREMLRNPKWWLKQLPQILAVDRISARSLILRVDKQRFRELLRPGSAAIAAT